ncbi:hypothetical protein ACHAXS_005628 [Conticribra weissflogii]
MDQQVSVSPIQGCHRPNHRRKAQAQFRLFLTMATIAILLPSLLLSRHAPSSSSSSSPFPSFRRLAAPAPVFNPSNPIPSPSQLQDLLSSHTTPLRPRLPPLRPYSLEHVLRAVDVFQNTFAVVVYDPAEDAFVAYYDRNHYWIAACAKLVGSFRILSKSLRRMFPERFDGRADRREWAFAMSSGDFPSVKLHSRGDGRWNMDANADANVDANTDSDTDADTSLEECYATQSPDSTTSCVDRPEEVAPILQFGSVFQNPHVIPSMIAMPNPQKNHLHCLDEWAEELVRYEREEAMALAGGTAAATAVEMPRVCPYYRPRNERNALGLVYGETVGITSWEELIPTVVWRGTDFPGYLHHVRDFRQPDFEQDVGKRVSNGGGGDEAEAAVKAMREVYDYLIPRWKGVVLTAEAELEARKRRRQQQQQQQQSQLQPQSQQQQPTPQQQFNNEPVIPWADIKFADCIHEKTKTPAMNVDYYQQFMNVGIPAAGPSMPLEELAKYRYHIDIGGGGGTTWSGTIEKLAMPGLLFHHVTPTKDYNYDLLVPWVHYVPIKEDLSDLHEKYLWAESHPLLARQISDRATEFARRLGTYQGFHEMYLDLYKQPLERLLEAYQPTEEPWDIVMKRLTGRDMVPVMKCNNQMFCENLTDHATTWKQLSGVTAM